MIPAGNDYVLEAPNILLTTFIHVFFLSFKLKMAVCFHSQPSFVSCFSALLFSGCLQEGMLIGEVLLLSMLRRSMY